MPDTTPDLTSAIETAAASPLSATADGVSATQHPIDGITQADKYLLDRQDRLAERRAARKANRGLRMTKFLPPSAL